MLRTSRVSGVVLVLVSYITEGGLDMVVRQDEMKLTVDHGILHLGNKVENSDATSNEGTSRAEDRGVELAKTEHGCKVERVIERGVFFSLR